MKCLEHIVPPFRLRVLRILNLEPAVFRVHARPPLGNHPFKISFDNFLKQQFAVALDVLRVKNLRTLAPLKSAFVAFSFAQSAESGASPRRQAIPNRMRRTRLALADIRVL